MSPKRKLPLRVYVRDGSYYWVQPYTEKWKRLCRVEDGEVRMLERLAAEKAKVEKIDGTGNIPHLVDKYVRLHEKDHKEKAWPAYGRYVKRGFADVDIDQMDVPYVRQFLKDNWKDKPHMQRVMRAFLSGFFDWCIDQRSMTTNPCRDVKLKKPKPRTTLISAQHFAAIREAMLKFTYERGGRQLTGTVPTGPMMQCFIDLCYLTAQRSTEIRNLRWAVDPKDPDNCSWVDRAAGVIHFRPSKTEDSSGVAVDIVISPEIGAVIERARGIGVVKGAFVIHTKKGKPYAANSVLKAWKVAKERAGLVDVRYTIKDIRAMALTDADAAGYDTEALKERAAHTNEDQTRDYIKSRRIPVSDIRLHIPKTASA
ncbi:integrase [Burkholderia stagnalis]|uniref:tyrosine-type recombinase/integrase n=1 Tax=Burkholderia stagnalis TaxID=1503054 RepID=UPI000F59B453|nr:tyrosine-type recombinase/integrase [Burkholderia stagnalis]RQQ19689.1 integrase [Burkholderia stagnalis]RQY67237.1 integrase [Burkholderia stagnalis]RQY80002.1 integrase [Burkholderia stagnalis]